MNERQPIYPCDAWTVRETAFCPQNNFRNETTFALSNGYIGTRGTFEEGYDWPGTGLEGNFLNGFYESEPLRYGECCFGFPAVSQTMLNVPNAKIIRLYLDGEPFDLRTGTLRRYERTLHMDKGLVTRELEWTSPGGKTIRLKTERLVSLAHKRIMALRYTVTPVCGGTMELESAIDGDVVNHTRETNPLIDYGPYGRRLLPVSVRGENGRLDYRAKTQHTQFAMGCACLHEAGTAPAGYTMTETSCAVRYVFPAQSGTPVVLTKLIAYASCPDIDADGITPALDDALETAAALGFDGLLDAQIACMRDFWETADIVIDGDDALQQGLRFNLFHVMQAAGRDGRTGMGAKGLSGEGYEGHFFWDTEMYVLPLFTLACPALCRQLLDFRYHTLEQARERAREMGHPKGALYPWRTINGREASAYYPLGTAQYHINGDIAYAFRQYVRATGDLDYLEDKAAEVLCETARVWADAGCFAESRGGKYCICCVTGPDEYNALVDNNFYTNLMARENLRDALDALACLRERRPAGYRRLVERLALAPEETALWQKIVDNMYLPYSEELDVFPQDDGFLQRKPWDEEKVPPEKRHLLYENYHPLFVFRHRMSKQADTILGLYLHEDKFTPEQLCRNYDYYQTVTLHHSSLSTCIFGMVACAIGRHEEAFAYFARSARMDLDDYHENFYAGIHAANMAGTWLAVVNGFAGLRVGQDGVTLRPYLPLAWKGYRFHVRYRGALLHVTVDESGVCCRALTGGLQLTLNGQTVSLQEGDELHGQTV